jgi:hypothetical protein
MLCGTVSLSTFTVQVPTLETASPIITKEAIMLEPQPGMFAALSPTLFFRLQIITITPPMLAALPLTIAKG